MLTASLVVTTIYDPIVLESYFENFQKYGHLDQVQVFVIPDRKTPAQAYERCHNLSQRGLRIHCPTIEEQETFLQRIGFPPFLVPYDSDNRRNVGYLMALESGTDFIITIDDDNYCRIEEDFFLCHSVVCRPSLLARAVTCRNRWFNPCLLLNWNHSALVYPRGFPYHARHKEPGITSTEAQVNVHINAGLWLQDPDLDAITWLVMPTCVLDFKGECIVLDRQTWSPINTQNTSLRRDALSAYYFVKMGYPLAGMSSIDRYGDIFSGYFVQVCAKHLGGSCRIGLPIVEHRRNTHNYFQDAIQEWACILVLEDLLPLLIDAKLEGNTYPETYISLSHALEDIVEKMRGSIWTDATRGYFHQMAYHMRLWAKVTSSLL